MSNSIALISLIILIACIAIGFVLKKNVGLIAILAAAIFGSVVGYSDSAIIKGFSSSTFIMLLGVSLLCTIATNNGTLELAAKKFLRLTGGHVLFAPIIMYLIGYIVAAIESRMCSGTWNCSGIRACRSEKHRLQFCDAGSDRSDRIYGTTVFTDHAGKRSDL